jgi:hypothetical protein
MESTWLHQEIEKKNAGENSQWKVPIGMQPAIGLHFRGFP